MNQRGLTRGDGLVLVCVGLIFGFSFAPYFKATAGGGGSRYDDDDYSGSSGSSDDDFTVNAWAQDHWPLMAVVVLLPIIAFALLVLHRYMVNADHRPVGGLTLRQWATAFSVVAAWAALWSLGGNVFGNADQAIEAGGYNIELGHGFGAFVILPFTLLLALLMLVIDRVPGLAYPLFVAAPVYPHGYIPQQPGHPGFPGQPGHPGMAPYGATGGFAAPVVVPPGTPVSQMPPPMTPPTGTPVAAPAAAAQAGAAQAAGQTAQAASSGAPAALPAGAAPAPALAAAPAATPAPAAPPAEATATPAEAPAAASAAATAAADAAATPAKAEAAPAAGTEADTAKGADADKGAEAAPPTASAEAAQPAADAAASEPAGPAEPAEPEFEQFWLAVPEPRPLAPLGGLDKTPVATLTPGTWYLAVEPSGDGFVVETDGVRGILQDTSGIQRGE